MVGFFVADGRVAGFVEDFVGAERDGAGVCQGGVLKDSAYQLSVKRDASEERWRVYQRLHRRQCSGAWEGVEGLLLQTEG